VPADCGKGSILTSTALTLVLLAAGVLRCVGLESIPCGVHQDEAMNAWTVECLLRTGCDPAGTPWPVFYTQGLGANRSTLYLYWLLPFQAVFGFSVWSMRFASAVAGVMAVWLMYLVCGGLFDRMTGVIGALLLAVCPWHVMLSRWGHESTLGLVQVLAPIAAMLWAGLPVAVSRPVPLKASRSLIAGVVFGLACFGYQAARILLPVLLTGLVVVNLSAWISAVRTRRGKAAVGAFLVGLALTLGPLAWRHVVDPEINVRGAATRAWQESDAPVTRVGKVLARWPAHFGPRFLLLEGDVLEFQSPPGGGQLSWYMLPLIVVGACVAGTHARRSRAARAALLLLVLYPAGDMLSRADGPHALRSLPGLGGLVIVAAVGCAAVLRLARASQPKLVLPATVAGLTVVLVCTGDFVRRYRAGFNRESSIARHFHPELLDASRWLRSRVDAYEAVFITTARTNQPYVVMMVGMRYDPHRWFGEPVESTRPGPWLLVHRVGSLHYMYPNIWQPVLLELQQNRDRDRVLFIVRPGELGMPRPDFEIAGPQGDGLWVREVSL